MKFGVELNAVAKSRGENLQAAFRRSQLLIAGEQRRVKGLRGRRGQEKSRLRQAAEYGCDATKQQRQERSKGRGAGKGEISVKASRGRGEQGKRN